MKTETTGCPFTKKVVKTMDENINKIWEDKTIEILRELSLSVGMVSIWVKGPGNDPMRTKAVFGYIRERQLAITAALYELECALIKKTPTPEEDKST